MAGKKTIPQGPDAPADEQGTAPAPTARRRGRRQGVALEDRDPELGSAGRQGPPPPKVDPSPPFWFVYDPNRWGVVGGQVVPLLYRLTARKGSRGMGEDANGKIIASGAFANVEERGHRVIMWDVDGRGTRYIRKIPTGGWITKWETVFPGSASVRVDEEGYARWVRSLCEREAAGLELPPVYILEDLIERISDRIARALQTGKESYRKAIARDQASLEVVRAELDAALSEEPGLSEEPDADDPASVLGDV